MREREREKARGDAKGEREGRGDAGRAPAEEKRESETVGDTGEVVGAVGDRDRRKKGNSRGGEMETCRGLEQTALAAGEDP